MGGIEAGAVPSLFTRTIPFRSSPESLRRAPRRRPTRPREEEDVASNRAVSNTLQKRDCHPSTEQVNPRAAAFRRPTLPELVRARFGTGRTMISGSYGFCKCRSQMNGRWDVTGKTSRRRRSRDVRDITELMFTGETSVQ